jgi:hypothetical protein
VQNDTAKEKDGQSDTERNAGDAVGAPNPGFERKEQEEGDMHFDGNIADAQNGWCPVHC